MALKKGYIHYAIALFIGLVFAFALKPGNGLTAKGVLMIAITLPTLYLWLTTNTHWTSILFLGMLVMTQIMTPNQVWAGSIGHFAVITMIVFMVLNECLRETGVINKIATWFITRKFVQNRPYAFLAMFFASNLFIGMFMENLSLAVIYAGIASAVCEKIGVKKGEPFYTCIFMGVLWGSIILCIASPIAHALPLILMGIAETQLHITITYGQWLAVGFPFAIIMFGVMMLCTFIWKPDATAFRNFNIEEVKKSDPPLDTRGKIAAGVFVGVILIILLPEMLKGVFPALCGYLSAIGVVVPAIMATVLLCIIQVDGKPILDMPKAMKSVPLPVVIFAGTVCVMSTPISSEVTGINIWLGNVLKPLIAGMSPFTIVALLSLFALIMTNFVSNTVTMILFFNIGIALLKGGNMNMGAFSIVIALASSMAVLTPSASVPAPIFFGPEHISVKSTYKYNLIFIALSFAVILGFVMPFASFILK